MTENMKQIDQSLVVNETEVRLVAFQRTSGRQIVDGLNDSHSDGKAEFGPEDHGSAARRGIVSRWAVRLITDLDAYLDLRLARFIIWRETRRRRNRIEG